VAVILIRTRVRRACFCPGYRVGLPVAQRGRQVLDELVGVVEHHRFFGPWL